jgi:hypothetical protein
MSDDQTRAEQNPLSPSNLPTQATCDSLAIWNVAYIQTWREDESVVDSDLTIYNVLGCRVFSSGAMMVVSSSRHRAIELLPATRRRTIVLRAPENTMLKAPTDD